VAVKRNLLANYFSQIYVAVIGIAILPYFLKLLGAEAYGLIGFFALLQSWFSLLDMGLTPTVARESARYSAGALEALVFRRVVRAITLIFFVIALIGGGSLWIAADAIAVNWLDTEGLMIREVVFALGVMAVGVSLRWMSGLYRGLLTGAERIALVSMVNVASATLRFIFVIPVMELYGYNITVFFTYQLVVIFLEYFSLFVLSRSVLPSINKCKDSRIGFNLKAVAPLLGFSMTIAFTSSVWVLVTQLDKLVLSGMLSLREYGYFVLAIQVAGGLTILTAPLATVLMPRMANAHAKGDDASMILSYRQFTQFAAVIVGSAGITLALLAKPILYVWTGDREVVENVAPIMRLYACGNVCLAFAAFPYYIQYAIGDLKLHLWGNIAFAAILIPGVVLATSFYGAIGAGWVWFASNFFFFLFWTGFVHKRLRPELNFSWIRQDIFRVISVSVVILVAASFLLERLTISRLEMLLLIVGIGLLSFCVAAYQSTALRELIEQKGVLKWSR
jgi:O-antigen/teichoic acid export membrane protein